MQAIQQNELTYQEIFQKALLLVNRSEKAKKDQIIANFQLGELVCQVQDNARYGDSAVVKLAEDLTEAKGYQIHASFLWECARVYRTFRGNLQRVWELEKELKLRGIQLSWRFLVRNCIPLPEPERVLEAEAYWEKKIAEWENSVQEIEEKIDKKEELVEKMPPKAREAFHGFVVRVSDGNIGVKINDIDRLESALKRVEKALDELLRVQPDALKGIRNVLEQIRDRIDRILGRIESG